MAHAEMVHISDPKKEILEALGNLEGLELLQNQVLVAVYQRPEKTKSGIILSSHTLGEDRYQSKVGLIVKQGLQAFVNSADWHFDVVPEIGDWIVYRPSDGWGVTIRKVLCRVLTDVSVKARINDPDLVW